MQHKATLLAQYLQSLVKRSQHFDAIHRNIVGRNMLCAFGHPVTTPWVLQIIAQTWPNEHNITQHPQMLDEKFDHFQT